MLCDAAGVECADYDAAVAGDGAVGKGGGGEKEPCGDGAGVDDGGDFGRGSVCVGVVSATGERGAGGVGVAVSWGTDAGWDACG